jgi:hypothetical protein
VPKPLRRRCRCGVVTIAGARLCAACDYARTIQTEGLPGWRGLPVACWCGQSFAWVAPRLVKAGLTRSCGLPGCEPIEVAA